nr:RNA polymerase beta'' subunit [Entransia fimbriata]
MKKNKNSLAFYNQVIDKFFIKKLLGWIVLRLGTHNTIDILDALKTLGFQYATLTGISLGIDDLLIHQTKSGLIEDAEQQIDQSEKWIDQAKINNVERLNTLIDTWFSTSEFFKQEMIYTFRNIDPLNPVYMMAFSGARGNISQVHQLVGMRGLMSDPQGKIIDVPIRSNFREGLSLTEYIISCYGARKGVVDTALRTADAGYLTRRLVDVAQHLVVRTTDCLTCNGLIVNDLKDEMGQKTYLTRENRLIGRVLAKNLWNRQKCIGSRNQDICRTLGRTIVNGTLAPILIRSPVTCSKLLSICQLCYGWNLTHGTLVNLGEAVGIIAGQSIGEPGTQLTMRTFHTGGVFTGDIAKQIRSPINGIIYFSFKNTKLVRNKHGKLVYFCSQSIPVFIYGPYLYEIELEINSYLLVNIGQWVQSKQLIAECQSTKNLSIEKADKFVYSYLEGEFMPVQLKVTPYTWKRQTNLYRVLTTGKIWILSAKGYKLYEDYYISPYPFYSDQDYLHQNVILSQYQTITDIGSFSSINNRKKKCLCNTNCLLNSVSYQKQLNIRNSNLFLQNKFASFLIPGYRLEYLSRNFISKSSFFVNSWKPHINIQNNQNLLLELTSPSLFSYSFSELIKRKLNPPIKIYKNEQEGFLLKTKDFLNFIANNSQNDHIIKNLNNKYNHNNVRDISIQKHLLKKELNKISFHKNDFFELINNKQLIYNEKYVWKKPIESYYNVNKPILIKNGQYIRAKTSITKTITSKASGLVMIEKDKKRQIRIKISIGILYKPDNLSEFTKKIRFGHHIYCNQNDLSDFIMHCNDLRNKSFKQQKETIMDSQKKEAIMDPLVSGWVLIQKCVLSKYKSCYLIRPLIHYQMSQTKDSSLQLGINISNITNPITLNWQYHNNFPRDILRSEIRLMNRINDSLFIQSNVLFDKKNNIVPKLFFVILGTSKTFYVGLDINLKKKSPFWQKSYFHLLTKHKNDYVFYNKNQTILEGHSVVCTNFFNRNRGIFLESNKKKCTLEYFMLRDSDKIQIILWKSLQKKLFMVRWIHGSLFASESFLKKKSSNFIWATRKVRGFLGSGSNQLFRIPSLKIKNKSSIRHLQGVHCHKNINIKNFFVYKKCFCLIFNERNYYYISKKYNLYCNMVRIYNPLKTKHIYIHLGDLVTKGGQILEIDLIDQSGQIVLISANHVVLRYGVAYLVTEKAIIHVKNSKIIQSGQPFIRLVYERSKTGDIIQGLPKVEQLFEARLNHYLIKDLQRHFKFCQKKAYLNHLFPWIYATYKTVYTIQKELINAIQRIYRSQKVLISDQHLETIIRQMTSRVIVEHPGDSDLFPNEFAIYPNIENSNQMFFNIVDYKPIILGVTRAALDTQSFLSEASFQQTSDVLSKAVPKSRIDWLFGIKENVILGQLIPAGTGKKNLSTICLSFRFAYQKNLWHHDNDKKNFYLVNSKKTDMPKNFIWNKVKTMIEQKI